MNFKPLHDRVIVKRKEADKMTESGIHVPEQARRREQKGTVIYIGSGTKQKDGSYIPLYVKPKDEVIFGAGANSEITIGDEKFLMMKESDIIGIVT
ncbi:co-chaperone GroES [bacterium]|nr:co-chaperone GroES [bacterium]